MTFKHKLSCRLALLKDRTMVVSTALLAVAAIVGCERPLTVTDPPTSTVSRLVLSPKILTLRQNQVADFTAVGLAPTGDTATIAVSWSVTSGSITDTSTSSGKHYGRYKAGSDTGKVKVTATGNPGGSDTAVVTVTPVPVASVIVSPASASAQVGQTVQLSATTKDSAGGVLTGRAMSWSSSNPLLATVNGSGLVTAVAAGSATITATSEGQSGAAAITVANVPVASVAVSPATASVVVGGTVQLAATPKDGSGNALAGRVVTWSSSNTSVATVNGGLVTAVAVGSATITATSEGQSGSSSITVTNVPVASVAVTPASAGIQVGQTLQLTATPKDGSGNALAGRVVTWSSSNASVATVNGGLVTAVAAGSATITATSEGQSGSSSITVTNVPVASVAVTPASAGIQVGQTLQLTATPKDGSGNPLSGRAVTWASSSASVATVSSSGLVTAVAAGLATITATSDGQSGTAAIAVTVVPVAVVAVTPALAGIQVGQTVQLTATPQDANGSPLSGRAVTWASSNGSAATVSGSGLVTAVAVGSAIITATSEGQSGTSSITVTNVPVASVAVTPASATIQVGQTQQLAATLKDGSGNTLSGRAVTWSSSSPSVASVNGSGLVTGLAAGSAVITATSEGKSGTATVTVAAPPGAPGAVKDLAVAGATDTAVTLSFTEVNDGTGQPASYDVRFAVAPISWGSATAVARGTCATPLAGSAIGAKRSCSVLGLSSSTTFDFQLVAFRGTLGVNAVFGALSNVATGTTGAGAPAPVASVTVSPASPSVALGGTQQFAATLKDANGNVLTGRAVTWSSGSPAIATVTGSGLATALLTGTTSIAAASDGQSGTAALTVTQLPPASGSWPNEPTGFSAITDYGFSDLVPATSDPIGLGSSGWSVLWNPVGNGSLIADAGAPFSPAGVYQVKYPTGFVDGSAPSTVEYVFGSRPTELYWGFWWKPSNPFQSDASGVNKIAFIWTPSGSTDLLYFDLAPNPWRIRCMDDLIAGGGPDAGKRDEPNVTTTAITLGQWHRIEIYVKYSTGSNADGMVKWWVDGQLNGQYTNLKMVQDGGFNQVSFSPTYGGAGGDVKNQTDYFWFDHTYLSRKP